MSRVQTMITIEVVNEKKQELNQEAEDEFEPSLENDGIWSSISPATGTTKISLKEKEYRQAAYCARKAISEIKSSLSQSPAAMKWQDHYWFKLLTGGQESALPGGSYWN